MVTDDGCLGYINATRVDATAPTNVEPVRPVVANHARAHRRRTLLVPDGDTVIVLNQNTIKLGCAPLNHDPISMAVGDTSAMHAQLCTVIICNCCSSSAARG